MVSEAKSEGLVARSEDLAEKGFNVLLVFFNELFLASAFVDDETNAERELSVVCEETDLLRDTIFDDSEVILGEISDDTAVRVAHTQGCVDKMGFYFDDRNVLRVGKWR